MLIGELSGFNSGSIHCTLKSGTTDLTLDFEAHPLIWQSNEYLAEHLLSKLKKSKFNQKLQQHLIK